ncbi:MAG: triose-phosphate isomerase [Pseudomonadota bacterium]
MAERRVLVAGNWKMNGLSAAGVALAAEIARRAKAMPSGSPEILVCPPATLIAVVAEAIAGSPVVLGGQDCHAEPAGARTGDISAPMLADLGCRYAIVGHSERRGDHFETSERVRAKAAAAHQAGLSALICIGETGPERVAGRTGEVIAAQLAGSLPAGVTAANTVIAYEPVWAIGTGRNASAAEVAEAHALIRRLLAGRGADAGAMRILYGGSVKPDNARELLAVPGVDGALAGGASLQAGDFIAIVEAGLDLRPGSD